MLNIAISISGKWSFVNIDCFTAYVQQTDEQYSFFIDGFLDPIHWINAIFFGTTPLEVWTCPPKGPEAFVYLSYCNAVITSGFSKW